MLEFPVWGSYFFCVFCFLPSLEKVRFQLQWRVIIIMLVWKGDKDEVKTYREYGESGWTILFICCVRENLACFISNFNVVGKE